MSEETKAAAPAAAAKPARAKPAKPAPGFHELTVTKKGCGQIHTGREDGKPGETFKRGQTFHAPLETAHALEERGFAEAEGDLPPLPKAGVAADVADED